MTEFRKDGWPLCPRCGDDEVYCLSQAFDLSHDHRTPPCPVMACYRCSWSGNDPRPIPEPCGDDDPANHCGICGELARYCQGYHRSSLIPTHSDTLRRIRPMNSNDQSWARCTK